MLVLLRLSAFVLLLLLCDKSIANPSILFQNSAGFSSENIHNIMQWFTQSPHPMGSARQKNIAQDIQKILAQYGWQTEIQRFSNDLNRSVGYNVIGTKMGTSPCALLIAGHYDTKYFPKSHFVGANDGGSQTAFLLELSRLFGKKHFKSKSLGSCSLSLVFFDGEEAFLPNWSDGEQTFRIRDNTYGSRDFVYRNLTEKIGGFFYKNKHVILVLVADMIGHKKQELFLTKGSDESYSDLLIRSSPALKISKNTEMIEDDHQPFLLLGIPVLHIIDWTNLEEWHTEKDTPAIISDRNIQIFGDSILEFLSQDIKGN